MLQIIEDLPDDVVGVTAKGHVTATDYEDVLVPAVEKALKHHGRIRFLYELGPAFLSMDPGAMWQDFKVGMAHLTRWERVAVVSDIPWITGAVNTLSFLLPCPTRVFGAAEHAEARAWISSDT